jgi:hypothetical protein
MIQNKDTKETMELKSRDRETKETWPDCGIVGTDDKEDVS